MSRILFSSDHHFQHGNIIKYANRPFRDAQHQDRRLITEWNYRVKSDDLVYYLGDFICRGGERGVPGGYLKPKYYIDKLNGQIIFILGNHDRNNGLKHGLDSAQIRFANLKFHMEHRPPAGSSLVYAAGVDIYVDTDADVWLCGHVHQLWKYKTHRNKYNRKMLIYNVGVDVHDFRPVLIDDICNEYRKVIKSNDPFVKAKKEG